jgi:hypothetical protein
MQKRELKDAIKEMSNNLSERIMVITQELITKDKKSEGKFLKRGQFSYDFDLPRPLFHSILKKMVIEFSVENKNVVDIIKKIEQHLNINEDVQAKYDERKGWILEDVERKRNGEPEKVNPKTD